LRGTAEGPLKTGRRDRAAGGGRNAKIGVSR
jgi:hypothetical protein